MWIKRLISKLLIIALSAKSLNSQRYNQIPIPQRGCDKKLRVLNDCNWCTCDENRNFKCTARHCAHVDVFGHFNDAIKDINVGMEGHGAWRSTITACEPGVLYRRMDLQCVCSENGNWPNPVCRDIFRVLHSVEVSENTHASSAQKCSPSKLYLLGCNVCVCPTNGHIDPNQCTTKVCTDDDPVLKDDLEVFDTKSYDDDSTLQDVYVECKPELKYKFGCKICTCLRNNRLLCGNCTNESETEVGSHSYCSKKRPSQVFNMDCNLCYCDGNKQAFCTSRKCLTGSKKLTLSKQLNGYPDSNLQLVEAPYDIHECIPGSKFVKDCNDCYCTETDDGIKKFGCTLKQCEGVSTSLKYLQNNCVKGSVYEINCLICHCDEVNGVKLEWCQVNPQCRDMQTVKTLSQDINLLHGYCEPMHVYVKDCNTCKCLSDGKTLMCTTKLCQDKINKKDKEPIPMEIIPVEINKGGVCPKGHSYKLDCNHCFCLSNGNALCTTAKCDETLISW